MKLFIKVKENLVFFLFLVFLMAIIFLVYKDYGIPWDEKIFFSTGKFFAVQFLQYLKIPTNLSANGFVPTPYHILGHGVFMDILSVFSGMLFPKFDFETLHLIRALLALPVFLCIYLIISKLISKVYGLISMILLLTFPRFYPEIYYNAVDIPTALLFTACLYYFIYYLKSNKTLFKSVIFGLLLGVAINQRLLLLFLLPLNFFFLLLNTVMIEIKRSEASGLSAQSGITKWRNFIFQQFSIFIFALLSMHLTHPYLLTHPLTGLIDIIKSAKQYPWNAAVLFEGQFFQAGVKPLPWYYLPKTILITSPPVTILLFIIGSFSATINFIRNINSNNKQIISKNIIFVYCLALFITPLVLVFVLKPTLYDSWRQFLFLTVPLIILAAEGLHRLLADKKLMISNYKNIPAYLLNSKNWNFRLLMKGTAGIILLTSLIITSAKMIGLHPYEYLYYNFLAGGLKGAYGKYETDYLGLGYKEAALWFNKKVNDPEKNYQILVEGDPLSSAYYFKPNMHLTTDVHKADYIFTFTRWNFHTRHPGKTIHTVDKEGVPLIFIKKI